VADDEGRPLDAGDDVGHREGLAGTGHAQEGLPAATGLEARKEGVDGGRLVALGYEVRHQFKAVHGHPSSVCVKHPL